MNEIETRTQQTPSKDETAPIPDTTIEAPEVLLEKHLSDIKEKSGPDHDVSKQAEQEMKKANEKFPHPPSECHDTPFSNLDIEERIAANCKRLIDKRKEIIQRLTEFKEKIQKHHKVTRTSKTGSTATSVVGSLLLFTPFAPIGIGMLGAGTVTGLGFTINDILKSKGYNKGIEQIVSEEEPYTRELQADLKALMEAAKRYAEEEHISFEEAAARIVTGVKEGNVGFAYKALNSKHKWGEFKSGLELVGASVKSDGFGLAAKASATVMTQSLAIVGSAFDVVDLVKVWGTEHPSADAIDRVVTELESGIRELELLRIIFK